VEDVTRRALDALATLGIGGAERRR